MKMTIFGHFYRKCLILIYWSNLLLYYYKHIFQAVWHSVNIYCLNKNTHIHRSRYDCHILKSRLVSKTGIFALDSSLVRMKPSFATHRLVLLRLFFLHYAELIVKNFMFHSTLLDRPLWRFMAASRATRWIGTSRTMMMMMIITASNIHPWIIT